METAKDFLERIEGIATAGAFKQLLKEHFEEKQKEIDCLFNFCEKKNCCVAEKEKQARQSDAWVEFCEALK